MIDWTLITTAYRTGHWINARRPGSSGVLIEAAATGSPTARAAARGCYGPAAS